VEVHGKEVVEALAFLLRDTEAEAHLLLMRASEEGHSRGVAVVAAVVRTNILGDFELEAGPHAEGIHDRVEEGVHPE
jgi:hypothetical protein